MKEKDPELDSRKPFLGKEIAGTMSRLNTLLCHPIWKYIGEQMDDFRVPTHYPR